MSKSRDGISEQSIRPGRGIADPERYADMIAFRLKQIPGTTLSGALVFLVLLWFVGLWVVIEENRQVSQFWLSIVFLIPLICVVLVVALLFDRTRLHKRLSAFDWLGLAFACFPILTLCWTIIMNLCGFAR